MTLTNAMVDSGFTYNGHKLFKTSVPGLYYTLSIFNVWSAWVKSNISANGLYIGDAAKQYFSFYVADPDLQRNGCNKANSTSKYWAIGGVMQSLTVEFYTDSSFDPVQTKRFNCYVLATIFMLFMLKALALALMNIVIFFL